MKPYLCLVGFIAALGISPGHARADTVACLQSIRQICAGQEDQLETCLAQKSARFTPECRDLLQNAISQAQSSTGVGACLDDVKKFCSGLDATALTQCLTDNYAKFTPACQKNLDTANAAAHH